MELDLLWMSAATLLVGYVFVFIFLRRVNGWHYALKLGKKQYSLLPPGDMGWPLLGNFLSFMRGFSSSGTGPDSFINNLVSKHGQTGIYKTHLFGNPSIILCVPDMCRRVLADDEHFKLGYPKATLELARNRTINDFSTAEHRRFRRLTIAPIMGQNALAMYIERIEDIMISSLEEMASMKHPVELLKEMKKVSFKVILHVFMGSSVNQSIVTKLGSLFSDVFDAILTLPINLPGFTYHKALKARKKLTRIVQSIVDERRAMMKSDSQEGKKDLVDFLFEVEDEDGRKLKNEEITDLLLAFLVAGNESAATGMVWSIIYLTENPQIMKKAKEEQEEIMRTRPPSQKHLDIKEIKQMVYLVKVIDEMLRRANIAFSTFREAIADVDINGYIIPKGWRALVWARAIHMNPEYYTNPLEFNPSRWDDYNGKAGTFIPFGVGSRFCPGSDLAKLEITIFLHCFLLNYKLERVNPECSVAYLPVPKLKDNCLAKVKKVS